MKNKINIKCIDEKSGKEATIQTNYIAKMIDYGAVLRYYAGHPSTSHPGIMTPNTEGGSSMYRPLTAYRTNLTCPPDPSTSFYLRVLWTSIWM